MLNIGRHISISGGFHKLFQKIKETNSSSVQLFIRNPYTLKISNIKNEDQEVINTQSKNINNFLIHAPYAINLCSYNNAIIKRSLLTVIEDLKYIESNFPISKTMYIIHPGNHTNQGIKKGIELIIKSLKEIVSTNYKTPILLETMSGKGSEVGSNFKEIKEIIDSVDNKIIGTCIDSCHIFAAGYDIINNLNEVFDEFNSLISLNKLGAVHLNDSMYPLGSNKDRHANIGKGYIGLNSLISLIKKVKKYKNNIPFILETKGNFEN